MHLFFFPFGIEKIKNCLSHRVIVLGLPNTGNKQGKIVEKKDLGQVQVNMEGFKKLHLPNFPHLYNG